MNIGIVKKNKYNVIDSAGNSQPKEYLEMIIDLPFVGRDNFTISVNKKKDSDNKPDYNIYRSFNRKGEKYRGQKVGSIWNKLSDTGIPYKNGHIEMPLFENGRMSISIFESKPMEHETQEQITWTHDVIWTPYRPNDKDEDKKGNSQAQIPSSIPEIEISDDEIPF